MTKTYKHKRLWWVVEENPNANWWIYWLRLFKEKPDFWQAPIPKEIIENSLDWEEIKQEDWIDKVVEEFNRYTWMWWWYRITEAIKKYMPKVSEEELKEINKSHWTFDENWKLIFHIDKHELIELLKSKWLLKDK